MNVEERVRRSLHDDATRIELPARPELAELESGRRVSGWRAGLLVAVAAAAALLVVNVARPFGVNVDPVDPPPAPGPSESWSFDADSPEVFAAGETELGVRWFGAATVLEDGLRCTGIRLEGASAGSSVGCTRHRPAPIDATVHRAGGGTVGVAGVVTADDAVRAVWELPDGPRELELHDLPGLDVRGFAAAAHHARETTMIWLYDEEGGRIAGIGVSPGGSRDAAEATETLPVAGWPAVEPAFLADGTPVFIVTGDQNGVRVLHAVSPHRPNGIRKAVVWCPGSERFVDPWHNSKFTRTGVWIAGPAPTGLARYDAWRDPEGSTVHVVARLAGPPRPSDSANASHHPADRACEADEDGRVEGPVIAHRPPAGSPTSPTEASTSDIVYVGNDRGTWDGATPRPDGSVDVRGFEQYVNALEPPPGGAVDVALLLFGLTPGDVDQVEAEPAGSAATRVTFFSDLVDDDSVTGLRRQATVLRRDDGQWTVTEANWAQACRPGRGHQDYSPEPCV